MVSLVYLVVCRLLGLFRVRAGVAVERLERLVLRHAVSIQHRRLPRRAFTSLDQLLSVRGQLVSALTVLVGSSCGPLALVR